MSINLLNIAAESDGIEKAKASGSKAFPVPREGNALFRMCSYIELGKEETEWKGEKKVVSKVLIEFELSHPDHIVEGEKKDGSKYRIVPKVQVRLNKSSSDLSTYMKLFKVLNWKGEYAGSKPTLAKFLGQPFFGQVHHNKAKTGDKVYVNITKDGSYTIGAPRIAVMDDMGMPTSEYKDIPIPELENAPRLFIIGDANSTPEKVQAMFDSLYIDGKNWIQETIKKSIGFETSVEGEILSGADAALVDALDAVGSEPTQDTKQEEELPFEPAKADEVDPLAALGI